MATVGTSTFDTSTAYPNQQKSDRFSSGTLIDAFYDGSNLVVRQSADDGTTWSTPANAVIGNYGNSSLRVDPDDYIHVVTDGSGINYRRGTPTFDANKNLATITWSAVTNVGGTSEHVPDLAVHREGTGWKVHVVSSWASSTNATYYRPIDITSGGVITVGGLTILSSTGFASHMYPTIAVDINKNLYVAWTTAATGAALGVRFVKGTYAASAWTWGTIEPLTEAASAGIGKMGPIVVDSTGRAVVAFCDAVNVRVFRRPSAGGAWVDLSPAQKGVTAVTSVDAANNIYLTYANSGLFRRKYDGASWSAAVTVDATTNAAYPSARRDAVAGSAADVVYTTGAASPYTVAHYHLALPGSNTARRGYNAPIIGRGRRGIVA